MASGFSGISFQSWVEAVIVTFMIPIASLKNLPAISGHRSYMA
jgi:hypothetical protein